MEAMTSIVQPLSDLKVGQHARVVSMEEGFVVIDRLREMGLTVGTEFKVLKVAPLGDPMEITFRSQRLCLRRADVCGIHVELI